MNYGADVIRKRSGRDIQRRRIARFLADLECTVRLEIRSADFQQFWRQCRSSNIGLTAPSRHIVLALRAATPSKTMEVGTGVDRE